MKILLVGNNEEYAVRDIIRLFIPLEKIEFIKNNCDNDCDNDCDNNCDNDCNNNYDIKISYEKINSEHFYFAEYFFNLQKISYSAKGVKYDKNYIKLCLFNVLLKIYQKKPPWGIMTGIRPSKKVRELTDYGLTDEEIYKILKDEYLVDDKKINLVQKISKTESKIIKNIKKNSVSLYVGIPFCPTRCLYCSFISQSIGFSKKLVEPYLEALYKEIEQTAKLINKLSLSVETVYIGGGTPTAISAIELKNLISKLFMEFDLKDIKEFSVEAGRADTIDEEKLEVLKSSKVDRISINPQTFNDETLKIIGRNHTAADVVNKFNLARKIGFKHINMDIIAGLPNEKIKEFENTLCNINYLNPDSVTVHTLSVKHGSYLAEKYDTFLSDGGYANQMIDMTINQMKKMNKHPYYIYRQKNTTGNLENIGFCKLGDECLYNIYIMQEVQTIFAMGAGASSKLVNGDKIERAFNVKEVSEYIKRIDEMILRKKQLFLGGDENEQN